MKQVPGSKTAEQMVAAIQALDLDPIKLNLMDKKDGPGWTRAETDHYEIEYRRFLTLLARFPEEVIAPNVNVDKFWHAHILDTMKYAEDCDAVFGYFLHHFPYFGMRDEEDAANLASAALNMQRLYRQEFGQAGASAPAYCGRIDGKAAAEAFRNTAYCGVVGAKGRPVPAPPAAYCGAVADRPAAGAEQRTAYCGIAQAAYCGTVAGKGRPKLGQAAGIAAGERGAAA